MHGSPALDGFDRRIVRELSRDGRMSNAALAERVGLSPSACSRRVAALEGSGVIRGYRALLDAGRLGTGFAAYVLVGLSRHTLAAQEAFEAAMADAEAVRECHNVTGTAEYLLRVEVGDLAAYKHFHTQVLGALPGVTTITSYIVLASPKDERG